ncbi:MAG: mycothiol transferase [Nostocoides sp.]
MAVTTTGIFIDAFTRVHEELPALLDGLDEPTLLWRPDAQANPIGWLAWHLTRVQDDHLAGVGQVEQVWSRSGFADRFSLPYAITDIGYGQDSDEVAAFSVTDTGLLLAYQDAVHAQTLTILAGLDDERYARIVDERFNPPVSAAVRLVSVIGDTQAHLGQIGYVRGLAERR